jgi:pimeloyl-ACP methyl ester carboxylesterase
VKSIELARQAYLETDLKHKLARYHSDPDSPFWGWNNIWLKAEFLDWSIEDKIAAIRCLLLAVQGLDDEYGTLEQVYGIARCVVQTEVVEITSCGHSPHRDKAQELIRIATGFMHNVAVA